MVFCPALFAEPVTAAPPAARGGAEASDDATSPLPIRTQLAFKPSYTFANGDTRYKAEVLFEPIFAYRGFLLPELDVPGFRSVARLKLTAEGFQDSQGPSSGLSDLTLVDLVAHRAGPFNVGLGYATVFPTATTAPLGQAKVQLGPAAGLRFEGIEALKLAVLVQNLYSVAGSSQNPNLAYVTVQPFLTLHLPDAFFFSSDATMDFYWLGGRSTVPVNLGFGRGFSEHFVASLRGWYTLADSGQGDVKVEVVLNFPP
jgi:hypothetical protein